MTNEKCKWTLEDNYIDVHWETECGNAFCFGDGGPTDNGMIYCSYCGRKLVEVVPKPEAEDDEEEVAA